MRTIIFTFELNGYVLCRIIISLIKGRFMYEGTQFMGSVQKLTNELIVTQMFMALNPLCIHKVADHVQLLQAQH